VNPFPVILSAPSGGGKTTIARELLKRRADLGYSVSCTTRKPRVGEVDGRDYYFLSVADFERRRDAGDFAEAAEVHGNMYGTLRSEVARVLGDGKHVVMDIDVQGAQQFTRAFPQSVTVFVLPPSAEVLLERLRQRRTESKEQLAKRLQSALQELAKRTRVLDVGVVGGEQLRIRDLRADGGGAGESAAAALGGSGSAAPPLLEIPVTELAHAHAALGELFA